MAIVKTNETKSNRLEKYDKKSQREAIHQIVKLEAQGRNKEIIDRVPHPAVELYRLAIIMVY